MIESTYLLKSVNQDYSRRGMPCGYLDIRNYEIQHPNNLPRPNLSLFK